MNINNNLKKLRTEAGLTQEQVAEKLNVTRQALSSYESGRTRPDIDTLVRLAVNDTDVNSIIYGPEDSTVTEGLKKAARFLAVLLIVLTALRSALALCSNTFSCLIQSYIPYKKIGPPSPIFSLLLQT